MTETQTQEAEQNAKDDAAWLGLILLTAGSSQVQFRSDVGRFYVLKDGKWMSVSVGTIREQLNRIEERIGSKLEAITSDLEAGRISQNEWQRSFERYVTSAHILTAALALGGIAAAVRNADVQSRIDAELRYADGFAKDLREGKAGSWKQIKARANSYLLASFVTYGIIVHMVRKLMGVQTECRRVRRASESCPGCVEWASKGWMRIEKMKPIGGLQCRSRCRCYLEYR